MSDSAIVAAVNEHWPELLATVLAFVAIWQTHRANRFARLVAQNEGTFRRPELQLKLFASNRCKHFVILAPLSPPPLLFPIPLDIANVGEKTAKALQVLIGANEDFLPYSESGLEKMRKPNSEIAASFVGKAGHVNTVMYQIPQLHSGRPARVINTALLSTPSVFASQVDITTADGVSGTLPYTVRFTYHFDVVVFQEDATPLAEAFRLSVLDISNQTAEEALEQYLPKREHEQAASRRIQRWWRVRRPPVERLGVITIRDDRITVGKSGVRQVAIEDIEVSEALEEPGGLWAPALGIALGVFRDVTKRALGKKQGAARDGVTASQRSSDPSETSQRRANHEGQSSES